MKRTTKTIALVLAIGMISTTAAFAEYDPNKVIDPNVDITTTKMAPVTKPVFALSVDDEVLEVKPIVLDNKIMVPLRVLAEKLEYGVSWEGEAQRVTLVRGAHYITLSPTKDEYTFAKTAPMKLGTAPEIIDSLTFVPVEFISDILQLEYNVDENGTISVVYEGTVAAEASKVVEVLEVNENKSFMVKDEILGDVIVRISEDTLVTEKGEKADISKVKKSDKIRVEYSSAMTASLPPQTTAIKVELDVTFVTKDTKEETNGKDETTKLEAVSLEGTIKEVSENLVLIDVKDNEMDTALIVTKDTIIRHEKNRRMYHKEDLEEGMNVEVKHSPAMTFSIPPQTVAFEIILVD